MVYGWRCPAKLALVLMIGEMDWSLIYVWHYEEE